MYNLHLPARFPLPLPKSIKQSQGRITLQRYKNIIRPAQYDNFLRSESTKRLFSSNTALASRRFHYLQWSASITQVASGYFFSK